jgi:hypothetical protein
MTTAKASYYYAAGYHFFVGSYYGETKVESFEDVFDALTIDQHEEWLYVQSVDVDDAKHEVHIFIGNDE